MSNVHSEQGQADGIHIVSAFTYANDAARLADVRIAADVGKIAVQTDPDQPSYWVLDAAPNSWRRIMISPYNDTGSAMDRGLIAYQASADANPARLMGKEMPSFLLGCMIPWRCARSRTPWRLGFKRQTRTPPQA